MSRSTHLRRLALSLVTLGAIGLGGACQAATTTIEPPPQSAGAVAIRDLPTPMYQAAAAPADAGADAAISDAAISDAGSDAMTMPPVQDAMPTDAAKTLQP